MAYTKKTPPTGSPTVNFGGQAFDANRTPLGSVDSGFITNDATAGTTLKSPQTVTAAADTVLVIPPNATTVIFTTTAFPVDISETAGHTQYITVPAGLAFPIDIARQGTLYLRGNGGSAVVSFLFQLVD